MKTLACLLVSLSTALAAVDGTVVNRTSGKPQPGAMVILFKLGSSGPEPLASVTSDAQGRFAFSQAAEGGPHLVEAAYAGVTYNTMLPPGRPTTNVQVDVYDSSRKPGAAKVAQHIVLLEPTGQQLNVSETFVLNNGGNVTWSDASRGTVRFYVPEAAKDNVRVMALAPHGMPVQRNAEEAQSPGEYKLNFAIKPGETRIDVSYSMPFSTPGSFSGKVYMPEAPTRLVTPQGVTLAGNGLRPLGNEPSTQAALYDVKGPSYKVEIQGTGALRAAAAPQDSADEESGPAIQQILPRVYDRLAWILVPASLALALGFVLLYRSGLPAAALPKGKRRG